MVSNGLATTLVLASVFVATRSMAQEEPGSFLYQESRICSEHEFVVWGNYEDLSVLRGQNAWTRIDDPEAIMFCGKLELKVVCPDETRFLWVTRSGEFEVQLACYSE